MLCFVCLVHSVIHVWLQSPLPLPPQWSHGYSWLTPICAGIIWGEIARHVPWICKHAHGNYLKTKVMYKCKNVFYKWASSSQFSSESFKVNPTRPIFLTYRDITNSLNQRPHPKNNNRCLIHWWSGREWMCTSVMWLLCSAPPGLKVVNIIRVEDIRRILCVCVGSEAWGDELGFTTEDCWLLWPHTVNRASVSVSACMLITPTVCVHMCGVQGVFK